MDTFECPKCGKTSSSKENFCIECDEPREILCPECGEKWRFTFKNKFCPNCGQSKRKRPRINPQKEKSEVNRLVI